MIANVRRIVTQGTCAGNRRLAEIIVQALNTGDVDRFSVKDRLPARDGTTRLSQWIAAGKIGPGIK